MQWSLSIFIILSFIINCYYLIWILKGLKKSSNNNYKETKHLHNYSIIITAHNEENHIGQCLEQLLLQEYPKSQYEILVIADRCTDGTIDIVNQFKKSAHGLKLIEIHEVPKDVSPKKFAIERGIIESMFNHFLLLDADVIPTTQFIQTMNKYFRDDTAVVVGLMKLKTNNTVWNKFLIFERILNWSVAVAGIGNDQPIISYGGDWGYTREAFEKVNGFENIKHSLGGDDDLLLQKFGTANLKVKFCFDSAGWVLTEAPKNFSHFLRQRKRHIAASKYYKLKFKLGYFLFHSSNILLWFMPIFFLPAIVLLIFRIFTGVFLIGKTNSFFKVKISLAFVPLFELLFLFYNAIIGPLTHLSRTKW